MAITATLSVSPDYGEPNEPFIVTCVVSNGEASDVDVTSITPSITAFNQNAQSSAAACGLPDTGPGRAVTVTAGGTATFRWGGVVYARTDKGTADVLWSSYSVRAIVRCSDGTEIVPSAVMWTCANNPQDQFAGNLWFHRGCYSGPIAALF